LHRELGTLFTANFGSLINDFVDYLSLADYVCDVDRKVRQYLSTIGRRGGRKSRRQLDTATAREMVKVREARRAFRDFHAACFWSFNPEYSVTLKDVPWVAEQLMHHGGRAAWVIGARLCR
jgi:hypothetical protein